MRVYLFSSGLDQEMPAGSLMNHAPSGHGVCNNLCALIQNGTVTDADINSTVMNILTPMFRIGVFDHPVVCLLGVKNA